MLDWGSAHTKNNKMSIMMKTGSIYAKGRAGVYSPRYRLEMFRRYRILGTGTGPEPTEDT